MIVSTAVSEMDSNLATKCMELCQTLVNQGRNFSFHIKMGKDFAFSMDSKEKEPVIRTWKKVSPSTLRRNARRQCEFLEHKKSLLQEKSNDVSARVVNASHGPDFIQIDGNDTFNDIDELEFPNSCAQVEDTPTKDFIPPSSVDQPSEGFDFKRYQYRCIDCDLVPVGWRPPSILGSLVQKGTGSDGEEIWCCNICGKILSTDNTNKYTQNVNPYR